ncbi:cytochrome-c peroxidase [Litorivivens sp.]|jgi:cytochrome c peroxidase|uniref:cytochrome-c peroxidase n=1 Tax=Litorivivens sp. TaxID=2020868 RepID=UPI003561D29B
MEARYRPEQIDLGRYLFFDPRLSGDGTQSCASCHQPDKGFSDGLPRSIGAGQRELKRGAPSLWNIGFQHLLMWDGRSESLQAQARLPLFSEEEMNTTPEQLEGRINAIAAYRPLFAQAFSSVGGRPITTEHIAQALAAFQSSLVSLNSRYDRYVHSSQNALNEQEIRGLKLFRSFDTRCSQCHTPPLFTNQQLAVTGTPEPEGLPFDRGAGPVFDEPTLLGAFKIPSLRNVAQSAPYMHSGVFADLKAVVGFYAKGRGNAAPVGVDLKIHWHIVNPALNEQDQRDLVAFLKTLNDETAMPVEPDLSQVMLYP